MKIVSYKMFGSTEEFEKWQIENDEIGILSIVPMVGVDMAYLYQLVDALSKTDPEKIDSAYVSTIIDKIFD